MATEISLNPFTDTKVKINCDGAHGTTTTIFVTNLEGVPVVLTPAPKHMVCDDCNDDAPWRGLNCNTGHFFYWCGGCHIGG